MEQNITKALVEKYGMRVEEIAVIVNASASAVRNWVSGKSEPHRIFYPKLEKLLERKRKAA